MKKLIVATLFISVISTACKKKSSDNPTTSSASTTNTTTPTFTDSSKVTATVNGTYSFISLNNYGVLRAEGKSTGEPKTWYIQSFVDTGIVNINLPKIRFQFKKNHLAGRTFPISGGNFTNDSVVASYRINGIVYKALSGTMTITKMDTVAELMDRLPT